MIFSTFNVLEDALHGVPVCIAMIVEISTYLIANAISGLEIIEKMGVIRLPRDMEYCGFFGTDWFFYARMRIDWSVTEFTSDILSFYNILSICFV